MSAFSRTADGGEVSGVLGQRFDAPEDERIAARRSTPECMTSVSGLTMSAFSRTADGGGARRWLIRPRIRPESKLQDKCFERTAALDVENTMCRVNGIGSNAGAWDAADQRIEAAGRRGGLCDSVTRRLLPAITITTTNVHARKDLPPPRRRPRAGSAGYPHGVLVCPPRNGGGVTPAAAVLADACSADAGACGRYLARRARATAVEKLVDEHPADFHLMDSAGYSRASYTLSSRPLRPLAIPSPSSLVSLLPFVLLSPSPPSLPSHLHLLSSPHLLFLLTTPYSFFSAIRRNAAPTYVPSEEDVLRARGSGRGLSAPALGPPVGLVHVHDWRVRACVAPVSWGGWLYWRMATSTTEEEKTQMQCRQTRRFGVLCGSLRRLFLSSLFSLLIFFLLDPSFRLNRMRGPLYLFESVIKLALVPPHERDPVPEQDRCVQEEYCLPAFVVPEGDNVNIAGAWRGARSGDCAGDECCGIQHTVLAPPSDPRAMGSGERFIRAMERVVSLPRSLNDPGGAPAGAPEGAP
ncbi:hypothetical protein B0H14DRAFT_3519545 [Mycena olivaceomarginata]|nr:hypothetical protein B0H14DRAFT_3519545 [Mycena olivaceomarginata]